MIDDVRNGMDVDAHRRFHLKSSYKPFDLPLPERHCDAAPHLNGFRQFVDEGSRQRQANGNIRIHALRTEAEKLGSNLFHIFPDFAFLLGRSQEVGRMECSDDTHSIHIKKFTAQLGNG